jgi:hypothetical protein
MRNSPKSAKKQLRERTKPNGLGISQRLLLFCDDFGLWCHLCVELDVAFPFRWDVVLVENRFYWALCDASFAVNALIGVNVKHLVPFVETLNGANDDAIGISASYARLGNDVGHGCENLSSGQKQ